MEHEEVHSFIVGDRKGPQECHLYHSLHEMGRDFNDEGYLPHTKHVVGDFVKEAKEWSLWSFLEALHSIRAARRLICLKINMHICKECHNATRLISILEGRKIILIDANREFAI